MRKQHKRQTSLFLIELMLALLFFSLAAAVSIQFFVQSNILSQQSNNLNSAILVTQSFAESFRATRGDLSSLYVPTDFVEMLPTEAPQQVISMRIFYDADWNPTVEEQATFIVNFVVETTTPSLLLATIETTHLDGVQIYGLEVLIQT